MKLISLKTSKIITKLILLSLLIVTINAIKIEKVDTKLTTESSTVFEYMKNIEMNKLAQNSTQSTNASLIVDLQSTDVKLEDWLQISGRTFNNPYKFPILKNSEGNTNQFLFGMERERVNEKYEESIKQGAVNPYQFWFKIRGGYMYYFATKEDINVLGSILVHKIENTSVQNKHSDFSSTCFNVYDKESQKYVICASNMNIKLRWLCSLQTFLEQTLNEHCPQDRNLSLDLEIKEVLQPVLIIPQASRLCNEKWNYINKGNDWECQCRDGSQQSPIDLPTKDTAILSEMKPLFQYEMVHAKIQESTLDGTQISGEYIKIRYDQNAIRIHHPNMGKIVSLDGGVYVAEEIVFHTPSEHTINGQKYDMEMQVVHYGKSRGDIAHQIVLSFLFKTTPGKYNKFIDRLDFFNLPNPTDTFRDITNDFFIPSVFFSTEDDDVPTMSPFSFYTYEGSISSPPCTERTTHYVASDPIELSNTVVQLFKEALRTPDFVTDHGDFVEGSTEGEMENNRTTQPLNGREVYIFDHVKLNCPTFKKKNIIKPYGHFEKRSVPVNEYVYVNGEQPTGLPGSFVVTENEAKNIDQSIVGDTEANKEKFSGKPNIITI